ncbi:tetratricopeptide repeat protein [Lysobacter sp. HA35]
MGIRTMLGAVALLVAFHASAAEPLEVYLPQADTYTDQDAAAFAMQAPPPGGNAAYRHRLDTVVRYDPKNVIALAERAYISGKLGDLERARADLAAAASIASPGSIEEGHVFWSRGWIEYQAGNYPASLDAFKNEIASHGGRPFWVPSTLATLYWSAGDIDTAVAWYAASVRSYPQLGTEEGMEKRIDFWRASEKQAMRGAFAEWKRRQTGATAP